MFSLKSAEGGRVANLEALPGVRHVGGGVHLAEYVGNYVTEVPETVEVYLGGVKAGTVEDVIVEDDAAFPVLMYSGRDAITQAVGGTQRT